MLVASLHAVGGRAGAPIVFSRRCLQTIVLAAAADCLGVIVPMSLHRFRCFNIFFDVIVLRLTTSDQVHGLDTGGDCDELRLLSDETTFLNLRAHGGSLSFLRTKVSIHTDTHQIYSSGQRCCFP